MNRYRPGDSRSSVRCEVTGYITQCRSVLLLSIELGVLQQARL
jgi:hypothetical protein